MTSYTIVQTNVDWVGIYRNDSRVWEGHPADFSFGEMVNVGLLQGVIFEWAAAGPLLAPGSSHRLPVDLGDVELAS